MSGSLGPVPGSGSVGSIPTMAHPGHGLPDEDGFRAACRLDPPDLEMIGRLRAALLHDVGTDVPSDPRDPDVVVAQVAARFPDADVAGLADLVHRVGECFATRIRRRDDLIEVTRTRRACVRSGTVGSGRIRRGTEFFPTDVFSIRPDGCVVYPDGHVGGAVERTAWKHVEALRVFREGNSGQMDRTRIPPDPLSAVDAMELVGSDDFREILSDILRPPADSWGRRDSLDTACRRLAILVAGVCVFSITVAPYLDGDLLARIHDAGVDDGFPVYGWILNCPPEASARRRQAFGTVPFVMRQIAGQASREVDAGASTIALARRVMRLEDVVDVPLLARVVRSFARDPGPRMRGSADGPLPVVPDWKRCERVEAVARTCAMMGGADVLSHHSFDAVHRAGRCCVVLYRYRSGDGIREVPPSFPGSVSSALLREAPALAGFFSAGGLDWVRTVEIVVKDALRQDGLEALAARVPDDARTTLDVLLRGRASVRSLIRASETWHAGAGTLQQDLEILRGEGDLVVDPPTERALRLPSGTLRWLTSSAELRKEGREMAHCVASLSRGVLSSLGYVASIEARDGTRATASFGRAVDGFEGRGAFLPICDQIRGRANEDPSEACSAVVRELLHSVSDGSVAWVDPEIRPFGDFAGSYPPSVTGAEILDRLRSWLPRRQAAWKVHDWARAFEPDPEGGAGMSRERKATT